MRTNPTSKLQSIATTMLLLLTIGGGLFFWHISRTLNAENHRLAAEMQGLELEKIMIERELDGLIVIYNDLRSENEKLLGRANSAAVLMTQKDTGIKKIKSQNRRDIQGLRKQVANLHKIKTEYETIISTLHSENEHLRNISGATDQL